MGSIFVKDVCLVTFNALSELIILNKWTRARFNVIKT